MHMENTFTFWKQRQIDIRKRFLLPPPILIYSKEKHMIQGWGWRTISSSSIIWYRCLPSERSTKEKKKQE